MDLSDELARRYQVFVKDGGWDDTPALRDAWYQGFADGVSYIEHDVLPPCLEKVIILRKDAQV